MKSIFFAVFLFLNTLCFGQSAKIISKNFSGRWQTAASNPQGEYWEVKNDSTWSGKGYYLKGKDTVITERIDLKLSGKKIYYIPTVADQNNAQPVVFTMTSFKNNVFVFENPAHDYPKRIVYDFSEKDRLDASIDGGGKPQHFSYTRVK